MKRPKSNVGAILVYILVVGSLLAFLGMLYHDAGVKQRAYLEGLNNAAKRSERLSVRMPEGYRMNIFADGSSEDYDPEGVLGGPQY